MIQIYGTSTGFEIVFPYSPAMVEQVKRLPNRRWDGSKKSWTVPESSAPALADWLEKAKLPVECSDAVKTALARQQMAREETIAASRASATDAEIPCPGGLSYLPFQRAGISYASGRQNVLIADEMGLGKTIQAIGNANTDDSVRSVLIICPASLRINWMREWKKWDTKGLTVGMANGVFPDSQVVIINYDIVKKHLAAIHARQWDMLICDECHYLKNHKAKRTNLVLGKWDREASKRVPAIAARRKVFLTGTPILNRPIELWSVAHAIAPTTFKNWRDYAVRYCDGHEGRHGWDVTGASNLGELQEQLRASCMVRRLKADVLTELPAKRRTVIEFDECGTAVKREQAAYQQSAEGLERLKVSVELAKGGSEEDYAAAVSALRDGASAAFTEMAKLRHTTALAKLPMVIEHLTDAIESGKVVCFAHHRDVVAAIVEAFPGCVSITGDTSMQDRQDAVDRFQKDPECHLFVGNLKAAGVGLTLTASSHVVFAELDWVPGNISQAEDRCHRIGQRDSVLVQHLVLAESLDATMAKRLIEKQAIIDGALDNDIEAAEPVLPIAVRDVAATASASRRQICDDAEKLTADEVAQIHLGLKRLAAMCDGAHSIDGSGFNKLDTAIGKSLAACAALSPRQAALGKRLTHKYRRQLV